MVKVPVLLTDKEKAPSLLVFVALEVPFKTIVADSSADFDSASITFPAICMFCASVTILKPNNMSGVKNHFKLNCFDIIFKILKHKSIVKILTFTFT